MEATLDASVNAAWQEVLADDNHEVAWITAGYEGKSLITLKNKGTGGRSE